MQNFCFAPTCNVTPIALIIFILVIDFNIIMPKVT